MLAIVRCEMKRMDAALFDAVITADFIFIKLDRIKQLDKINQLKKIYRQDRTNQLRILNSCCYSLREHHRDSYSDSAQTYMHIWYCPESPIFWNEHSKCVVLLCVCSRENVVLLCYYHDEFLLVLFIGACRTISEPESTSELTNTSCFLWRKMGGGEGGGWLKLFYKQ